MYLKQIVFVILYVTMIFTASAQIKNDKDEVLEVSPTEDLMREHGVLNRLLLIYEEFIKRLGNKDEREKIPSDLLNRTAVIVRSFIEDYHEKLEEEYIFPKFEKSGKMVDLVMTLKEQHQKGRILTDNILQSSKDLKNNTEKIQKDLELFVAMYRPHEAREDTVLFPAFKTLVTQQEYDSLGETFEKREEELFGKDGFTNIVNEVAVIEKELGIHNLSEFTPKL